MKLLDKIKNAIFEEDEIVQTPVQEEPIKQEEKVFADDEVVKKIDIEKTIPKKIEIPKEDVMVVVTNEGYVKRVSKRSYNKDEDTLVKDGDYVIGEYELNTLDYNKYLVRFF